MITNTETNCPGELSVDADEEGADSKNAAQAGSQVSTGADSFLSLRRPRNWKCDNVSKKKIFATSHPNEFSKYTAPVRNGCFQGLPSRSIL